MREAERLPPPVCRGPEWAAQTSRVCAPLLPGLRLLIVSCFFVVLWLVDVVRNIVTTGIRLIAFAWPVPRFGSTPYFELQNVHNINIQKPLHENLNPSFLDRLCFCRGTIV